jgi:hypothetical protein
MKFNSIHSYGWNGNKFSGRIAQLTKAGPFLPIFVVEGQNNPTLFSDLNIRSFRCILLLVTSELQFLDRDLSQSFEIAITQSLINQQVEGHSSFSR